MKKSTTEVMEHLYNEKLLNTNLFDMIFNDVDINILRIFIKKGWVDINDDMYIDTYDNRHLYLPKWKDMGLTHVVIYPAAYAKELGRMKIYELLKKEGAIEKDEEEPEEVWPDEY